MRKEEESNTHHDLGNQVPTKEYTKMIVISRSAAAEEISQVAGAALHVSNSVY
jgi:hypothetical protein